jgi:hypothetical protein
MNKLQEDIKSYDHDKKESELIVQIEKHKNDYESAANPGYSQLNFPYNNNYINTIDVGKIRTLPVGGIDIKGKHTNASCAMNAALIYNEKNSTALDSTNYEKDMMYKIKFQPAAEPTVNPTVDPTAAPTVDPTAAPTVNPTSRPIIKTGLYSKILPFPAEEPVAYPIDVELTGLLLPLNGGNNGKISFDPKGKTLGIWLGIKPNMCTRFNAIAYYENGVAVETYNSKSPILFLRNTFIPIVIKYSARIESDVIIQPFTLTTNSGPIEYAIYVKPDSDNFGTPVYYNFTKNDGKCVVYPSSVNTSLLENTENYTTYIVEPVLSIPLSDSVEFVGLNASGTLTQYYTDPALKSMPVKTARGVTIEAKNKGNSGTNKKANYSMILDDSVKPIKDTKTIFAFPIDNLNRSELATNSFWKTVDKHYLKDINNSGQTPDRGLSTPSMKITKDMPLFSKDYKLKMAIVSEGGFRTLKVYKNTLNPNLLVSVIPDYKMGKLFVADENMGAKTMHLVKNDNTQKQGWVKYDGYGPHIEKGSYTITNRKGDGDCEKKATAKSHYFVENGNKSKCIVPSTNKSIDGYSFIPNSSTSMYVPARKVTSNDAKKDEELKLNKYTYTSDAYSKGGYPDFNLAKKEWDTTLNLSKQNTEFNTANNFTLTRIGAKSQGIVTDSAMITPNTKFDGFATLQDRTLGQIDNSVEPRFNYYLNRQSRVNQNASIIKNNIAKIEDKYGKMSATDTETNRVKTNVFYDFTDSEVYSLKEDRSLVPAMLKDQQTLIVEQNKLYVISTIAVSTLLISAIFVSSN